MSVKKKAALGRGLGALLQNMEADVEQEIKLSNDHVTTVTAGIAFIPIAQIEANPLQPRKEFKEELLVELSESIRAQGVIVPITVRKTGVDKYQLIAGERRFRASKMAHLQEIPAYIRVATDAQVLEMALVENIQRADLNPIEVALSYQALISDCNLTHEKLSERVGKNRTTITNALALLKLPAEIQVAVEDGSISAGHARAMIAIEDPEKQLLVSHEIIQKNLSVRAVENLVKNINAEKQIVKTKEKPNLPELHNNFKTKFQEKTGLGVDIKRSQRGKGHITISFANDKDFQKLLELIG